MKLRTLPNALGRSSFFQVKEMEYNRVARFISLWARSRWSDWGYGGYVWWQMRPKQGFMPRKCKPAQPPRRLSLPFRRPPVAAAPELSVAPVTPTQPAPAAAPALARTAFRDTSDTTGAAAASQSQQVVTSGPSLDAAPTAFRGTGPFRRGRAKRSRRSRSMPPR